MGAKPKPFECREDLFWYLVGLIATDGCLSSDGRHVEITSNDPAFLTALRDVLQLRCRVTEKFGGLGRGFHLQITSTMLYKRLMALGLTPRKSLTIGPLRVPDRRFRDFLRGVIDGDGNIRRWIHPTNGREQWALRIYSASKPFVAWLQKTSRRLWRVEGALLDSSRTREKRLHPLFVLKLGKLAAKVVLTQCYYSNAFALERKRRLAEACAAVPVGWMRSQTVHDLTYWRRWTYRRIWNRESPGVARDGGRIEKDFRESMVECDAMQGEWRNWRDAAGLKPAGRKALWVRLPPRPRLGDGLSNESRLRAVSSAG